jgi:hypothetical protein
MFAPINVAGAVPFNDWFVPDSTQRWQLGAQVEAVDPYWGYGIFQYVKSNDAILKGSVCVVGTMPTFLATLHPNTANLGYPMGIAMAPMASGVYGWLQIAGAAVYKTNATVAADAVMGLTAAGILGAATAGKGVLNNHNVKAATATTAITNVQTVNGQSVLYTKGYDGWFIGMTITGTGINGSATVIAGLDPDGRTVYLGSAIGTFNDRPSTATGVVTITGTYTGFGAGMIQYPCGTYVTV